MEASKLDKLIAQLAVEMYDQIPRDDPAWELLRQFGNRIAEIQRPNTKKHDIHCQHLNRIRGNQNDWCADCGFFPLIRNEGN